MQHLEAVERYKRGSPAHHIRPLLVRLDRGEPLSIPEERFTPVTTRITFHPANGCGLVFLLSQKIIFPCRPSGPSLRLHSPPVEARFVGAIDPCLTKQRSRYLETWRRPGSTPSSMAKISDIIFTHIYNQIDLLCLPRARGAANQQSGERPQVVR